jgi:glycosyltransferase involved in cell wall biosynthesis
VIVGVPPSASYTDALLPLEPGAAREESPELSIVMPCLNEVETLAACIGKAWRAIEGAKINAEIIVADNGSTDGSQALAASLGARIIPVPTRGYGSALMGGIEAAKGRYVLMGDADDSYDFSEVPKFVAKLREGYELVQGCRLPGGGGTVAPGAMPTLHRWWGNPMFSWMARVWFRAPVHDVYCGMRAFTRDFYVSLDLRCIGMEFATEMLIKSSLRRARIAEVPITLHPDGRTAHPPHLKTFRDGWRTLRFYLMYSPRWLYVLPGLVLGMLGLIGYAIAMPQLRIHGMRFDVHTLLFASLAIIAGYQSMLFGVFTKTFAISEGLLPHDERMGRFVGEASLERGLITGVVTMLAGLGLLGGAVWQWYARGFGDLDYAHTLRWVIPGVTLTMLGFQTVLASFFLGILALKRR